jgi:ankyrin repeat protein
MASWQHIVRKFTKQHAVVATPESATSTMYEAIETLVPAAFARERSALHAINWTHDLDSTATWLRSLLTHTPPPPQAPSFWFRVSDLGVAEPQLHANACAGFDERASQSDWASEVIWPAEQTEESTIPRFSLVLPSLAHVRSVLLTQDSLHPRTSASRPHFAFQPAWHALPALICMLSTRYALTRIDHSLSLQSRSWRGVGFGYPDSDLFIVGILHQDGWQPSGKLFRQPLPPPPPRPRLHENPQLDLNSESFSASHYLASGLSLGAHAGDGRTPLMRALEDSNDTTRLDVAMEMIRRGADINAVAPNQVPPFYFFLNQPAALLRFALEYGGDITLQHSRLITPLMSACNNGSVAANIKLLLAAGASPNVTDSYGNTPLLKYMNDGIATYKSTPVDAIRIIRVLLRHGADINAANIAGETPLLRCLAMLSSSHQGQIDTGKPITRTHFAPAFRYLLRRGANPNAQAQLNRIFNMPDGGTPLMYGIYADSWLHHVLLDHGANPHLRCPRGRTAIDYLKAAHKRAPASDRPMLELLHRRMLQVPTA